MMKHEITFMLDAMNDTACRLMEIQEKIATPRDAESLAKLVSLAIEYITQLNLLLLKSADEIEREYFKSKLIMDSIELFIGDVELLTNAMEKPQEIAL